MQSVSTRPAIEAGAASCEGLGSISRSGATAVTVLCELHGSLADSRWALECMAHARANSGSPGIGKSEPLQAGDRLASSPKKWASGLHLSVWRGHSDGDSLLFLRHCPCYVDSRVVRVSQMVVSCIFSGLSAPSYRESMHVLWD